MRRISFVVLAAGIVFYGRRKLFSEVAMNVTVSVPDDDGLGLTGTVPITTVVSPTQNLRGIDLFIDNTKVGTGTSSPYVFQWDTTQVADGTHVLRSESRYKSRKSVGQIAVTVTNAPPPPPPSGDKLRWTPPALTNPITVQISNTGLAAPSLPGQNPNQPWVVTLAANQDYIIEIGHRQQPAGQLGGLSIGGGRNVVIVGGQVTLPLPTDASIERHGFTFHDQTGVVHVEGVLVDGYPCRGVVLNSTQATFQIQNCRVQGTQMYKENFGTAHSDIVLCWKSPPEIRIDKLTAEYDNTGFAFYGNNCDAVTCQTFPLLVKMNRVNFRHTPGDSMMCGAGYYTQGLGGNYMFHTKQTRLEVDQFWAETGWGRAGGGDCPAPGATQFTLNAGWDQRDGQLAYANSKTLVGNGVSPGSYLYFTNPANDNCLGLGGSGSARVDYGVPPTGDYVLAGVAGASYVSPGYL